MIVYDLACNCGFIFEGWFQDRAEFIEQMESGLIICPECGSNEIRKILSPVSVCSSNQTTPDISGRVRDNEVSAAAVLTALRTIQKYVEKNFDDVGTKLAERSLKIHFGVEEPRNIRGVVTAEEEKTLEREGIELLKIPVLSEDDPVN